MKRKIVIGIAVTAGLLLALWVGLAVQSQGSAPRGATSPSTTGSEYAGTDAGRTTLEKSSVAPQAAAVAGAADTTSGSQENSARLVVLSSSMSLEVKDASKGIDAVRAIAGATNSEISNLTFTRGPQVAQPLAENALRSGSSAGSAPSIAEITLRIPAASVPDVVKRIAALGVVTSQSSSQDDVTEQHIDMSARLKNLRSEEAQLRGFMSRAGKISDLLSVERELSRVRGEIESMQAQLTYLERQAALATLTVRLSEPGAIVRPDSDNWGFAESVTRGIQAAASFAKALITGSIALSPLALLLLLGWAVVRAIKARRARREQGSAPETE